MEVQVPYLYNNTSDYRKLFKLVDIVLALDPPEATLKFDGCGFLMSNAVVVLGGLRRLMEAQGGELSFDFESMKEPVYKNLGRNGFLKIHGGQPYPWRDNAIPYREDDGWDQLGVVSYLEDDWLRRSWPIGLSDELKQAIVSRVVEIYLNSFEHSHSPVGVFSCGQYYPNKRRLQLSVADFGVGIPGNVQNYFARTGQAPFANAAQCMEWAFKRGTSTSSAGMARGLGLDLLRDFISVNDGSLKMFSHDGVAEVMRGRTSFTTAKSTFRGTLVEIEVTCDARSYRLGEQSAVRVEQRGTA